MIFYVEREAADTFSFDPEALGKRVAEAVLRSEDCPFEAEICLRITDDDGIRALNRTYRNQNRATDVLSFPALTFSAPADFAGIDRNAPGVADPETEAVLLGDIAVNAKRVEEQAKAYGHSKEREFAFLIAHSVLHLIGYDHADDGARADMEARQELVLTALNITRGSGKDA